MTRKTVWQGELVSVGRLRLRGAPLLSVGMIWLALFLMIPMLGLVPLSLAARSPYGEVIWVISLGNFRRLLGFGTFGWSADYLLILGRSVWIAWVTTVLCVTAAYPLSFFIASRPRRARYIWLGLLIVPFCTNLVIRTYAWMLILASQMPPARLAQWLGWIQPGEALYPGHFAVHLGMVITWLPFSALPIYTNVEKLDHSLVEAAADLYAGRFRIFQHAILPQTLPGLTAAVILTFIPSMGAFVVPDLLGGARSWLVGNLVQQQFGPSRDWPFGAAVSLVLIVLSLLGLWLIRKGYREVQE